jgi:hypothetical protein
MRKLFIATAIALCLPLTVAGQDDAQPLKDYSRLMKSGKVTLTLVYLNAKTLPVLFQPPTLFSIRARATQQTMVYVQSVVKDDAELDTTTFNVEQGGTTTPGVPTNISNFTKGKLKLKAGDRVDGIIAFSTMVDVTKPFVVTHGKDKTEFSFTESQLQALAPAAPAAGSAQQ